MITDSKITALTKELNESGYKFILITEKTSDTNPSARISSVTHSLDNNLTGGFVAIAASLAREAKSNPNIMKLIQLTHGFITGVDETFLNSCVQEAE